MDRTSRATKQTIIFLCCNCVVCAHSSLDLEAKSLIRLVIVSLVCRFCPQPLCTHCCCSALFFPCLKNTVIEHPSRSSNSAAVYLLIYFLQLLCLYRVSCNFSVFCGRGVRRRAPLNSRGYPQYGCLQGSKHHWSTNEYFV